MQAISDSFKAPVVFAHNDLLSGNFMYNEEKGNEVCSSSDEHEVSHFSIFLDGIVDVVFLQIF